jgi:hypothetical protein
MAHTSYDPHDKQRTFSEDTIKTREHAVRYKDKLSIHQECVEEFGEEAAAHLEKYIEEKAKDPKVIALFERVFGKAKQP